MHSLKEPRGFVSPSAMFWNYVSEQSLEMEPQEREQDSKLHFLCLTHLEMFLHSVLARTAGSSSNWMLG